MGNNIIYHIFKVTLLLNISHTTTLAVLWHAARGGSIKTKTEDVVKQYFQQMAMNNWTPITNEQYKQ